jgi:hypothetical protein
MEADNTKLSAEIIKQRIREKMHAIQALENELNKQEDDSATIESIINLCHDLMNEAHKLGLAEALSQKLLRDMRRETLAEANAALADKAS